MRGDNFRDDEGRRDDQGRFLSARDVSGVVAGGADAYKSDSAMVPSSLVVPEQNGGDNDDG